MECPDSRREARMTSYEKPEVRDYGSLRELTEAVDFSGVEDGGNKLVGPHHT
jgi:hypothetical protein